jgi:tetratricopeptide (TPR) repeat protein
MIKLDRKYDVLLVAIPALVVRLIYVFQLADTPFFTHPIVDAEYHDAWAREILRLGIGHEGVYFRAPLYPYFLSLIYSLTNGSYLAARLAQALLGTSAAVLTYLTGWELTRRRAVALLAGIGTALYGMLVYFDGELLIETLFTPLLIAAVWAYTRSRTEQNSLRLLWTGVFLGLAAITRPSALVLLPILILDHLFSLKVRAAVPRPVKRITRAFILTTGCFLPIFPVTWHNVHKGGDFVLIANQGGINFYIGNNPSADGLHSVVPGLGTNWDVPMISYLAYGAQGRVLKPSEVSAYYSGLARRLIATQLLQAVRLTAKKFCAFWNRLEVSNNRDLYFFIHETRIMPHLRRLGFWLVGPLGLLGLWLGWRKKLLPGWFLGFILLYSLSVIAFFVTARFRAPLIPFLLICAATALMHLPAKRARLLDAERIRHFALLILFGVFVNTNPWNIEAENPAHAHFCLGSVYLKENKLDLARREYHLALAADSTYRQVHLNLGVAAYSAGDLKTAEAEYLAELRLNPNDARALNNLGVIRFEMGDLDSARALYEHALQLFPYYRDAGINLAQCYFKLGIAAAGKEQTETAADYFSRAVELDPEKAYYHYNYALALGRLGFADAAERHLVEALRIMPQFTQARDLLQKLRASRNSADLPP